MQRAAFLLLSFVFLTNPVASQPKDKAKWPPSPHIAATEPLRPEAQLKKMKVPPGFEIQLVASDPDIRKPINIAFDAAGRLWVTETIEYPYAAKDGQGRDAVKILEDFEPDGKARKITTFVDKLNIPIGVLPHANGKGALVYTIPSIFNMSDSKGAGKADIREVLYSGFGFDDTHGMTGEFQQGFDGWIYACHGYRNKSDVKSKNGETSISMESGNTYRIKADGSRIEQFTNGQVNPFGLTLDPFGNLYSGDCHSKPLTMLLRGAWYESFTRPHDGLGFAPHMNTFKEHSTALCGVTYYAADQYPKEWHGKLFLGDVILNRMNAYRLDWTGATPRAIMEDFITSQDPWFRPVDIKLGPDGCLYVADFYNRVIGHYELPLDHPARDRDKGRIWRIVYRGEPPASAGGGKRVVNLLKADAKTLVETLANPNLSVRLHATDQLVERGGNDAVELLQPIAKSIDAASNGAQKAHALWVLERLGKLDDNTLVRAANAQETEVRVHALRILAERQTWTAKHVSMTFRGAADKEPFVRLAAIEAIGKSSQPLLAPLLIMRHEVDPGDARMLYAARLALREQLRINENRVHVSVNATRMSEKDHRAIADVCLGIQDKFAAGFMETFLEKYDEDINRSRVLMHHAVRHGDAASTAWALAFQEKKHAGKPNTQGQMLKTILQANQERGGTLSKADLVKCETTVANLLDAKGSADKQIGAELAGTLKLASTQPILLAMISKTETAEAVRKSCVGALVSIDAKSAIPPLGQMLLNEKEPIALREQVANALAGTNHADAHATLVQALQSAPARLQTTIALGMAGSTQGGERLLQAIEAGKASRLLLQDRAIEIRLSSAKIANVKKRISSLTANLPAVDQKAQELIAKKRDAFVSFKADVDMGQKIFQKHCGTCHQISGQGAKVGPHLDGIGVRGIERLLEDVLDPNRNVDQAFRTTVITTKAGQTINGLFLREEGEVVILGDNQGKEVRIEKKQIDERAITSLSPMPSNFAETVGEADFHHMMAYLLTQRGKK